MASDKSLPASQRKLNKAREDGDVAKSTILSSSVIISCGLAYIYYLFFTLESYLVNFKLYLRGIKDLSSNNMLEYAKIAIQQNSGFLVTFFVFLLVVAVGVECVQVGFCFSLKHLALNFNKLNPVEGFKKNILKHSENEALMFGLLIEIVKMLTVVFSFSAILFANLEKFSMLLIPDLSLNSSYYFLFSLLVLSVCVMLLVGAVEYLHLRIKRLKRLQMDVNEFKQEMRESEGDPHFKGMRKQLHQELSLRATVDAVRKAKVLVVGK